MDKKVKYVFYLMLAVFCILCLRTCLGCDGIIPDSMTKEEREEFWIQQLTSGPWEAQAKGLTPYYSKPLTMVVDKNLNVSFIYEEVIIAKGKMDFKSFTDEFGKTYELKLSSNKDYTEPVVSIYFDKIVYYSRVGNETK